MKRIATFAAMLVLAACAAKEEAPAADTAAPAAAPAAEMDAPVADTMKMDSTAMVAPVADSATKL